MGCRSASGITGSMNASVANRLHEPCQTWARAASVARAARTAVPAVVGKRQRSRAASVSCGGLRSGPRASFAAHRSRKAIMPSFDIVSEVNQVEVRNAVDQANKEIGTRFDFKGSDARVEIAGQGADALRRRRLQAEAGHRRARGQAHQARGGRPVAEARRPGRSPATR